MKILVVGGTSVDEIIPLKNLPEAKPGTLFAESFRMIGGTGAGKAVALKRLGNEVRLFSVIGEDPEGEWQKDYFAHEKIDFTYAIDSTGSERHVNLMSESGERISIFTKPLKKDLSIDTEKLVEMAKESDILVINIIPYVRAILPHFATLNKPVWVDLHDYDGRNPYHKPFLDIATFVTMSSDKLEDQKSLMLQMIDAGKELVASTAGVDGSDLMTVDRKIHHLDAIDLGYQDANGAGDSFFSGLLTGYMQTRNIVLAHQWAVLAASLAVATKAIASPELTMARLASLRKIYYP